MKNELQEKCIFCGKECNGTIYLHAVNDTVLRNLDSGESAHYDCYLEISIDRYLTKKYDMTSENVDEAIAFYGRNVLLNGKGSSEDSRNEKSLADILMELKSKHMKNELEQWCTSEKN